MIKPGRYRHFKGNEYEVIGTAKHSETLEEMVVYRALYGEGGLWVRPASMWEETVVRDGVEYKRFEYIGSMTEKLNDGMINEAADMVMPIIENDDDASDYIDALKTIVSAIDKASEEDIDSLDVEENIKTSFHADKKLFDTMYKAEKDRVSLINTLIVYICCKRLGYEDHSPKFMRHVGVLRKKIESRYNESVEHFCG